MTSLGVLCCFAFFVCLTLLASFFLPSHLSFKNMYNTGIFIQIFMRGDGGGGRGEGGDDDDDDDGWGSHFPTFTYTCM